MGIAFAILPAELAKFVSQRDAREFISSLLTREAVMSQPRSEFLRVLSERGFIHQCSDVQGLDARALAGPIVAYVGYDATADSLHVGHLVSIMMLRWLQRTGHRPIALMGGGTTKVGDPSGKDDARRLMAESEIDANIAAIGKTFARFLDFSGERAAIMANNADWLDRLLYIPMLREFGRHFSVNRMLTMDSVKLRLEREQPLSFLEFNYMLLQAYDFVELAKRHGCALQMGGSDQWGNIVMGVEMGRRVAERDLFALTTPLITTASGAKMGKTASGAVWLAEHRLPAYDYYQYWRNADDADVGRFLRLFTDLPLAEIARLEKLQGAEINEAKKRLAFETTRLLHGEEAATRAAATAQATFEAGGAGEGLPQVGVGADELAKGVALYALLVRAGLAASNGEARRLIQQGGARVNDVAIQDPAAMISASHRGADGAIKLSAGKKRHALVRVA